ERLREIAARYEELTRLLSDPDVASDPRRLQELGRERASLEDVVRLYRRYEEVASGLDDTRALAHDADEEMRELGREEEARLEAERDQLAEQIKLALLPKDPADEKDVIVEIRAGTGGEEAALFASDLFRMYQRYAERNRWQTEILNTSE